jgi:hypothetical protein
MDMLQVPVWRGATLAFAFALALQLMAIPRSPD